MKLTVLSISVAAFLVSVAGATWLLQTGDAKNQTLTSSRHSGNLDSSPADTCCTSGMPEGTSEGSLYVLRSKWTNQNGDRISLSDLGGKIRVVAMFYSRCPYACPMTINDMKKIEASIPSDLREQVGFVLVSFDPAQDTPQTLREMADSLGLDGGRWTLLTGSTRDDRTLAALLGVEFEKKADGTFMHSTQITVLNSTGGIVYKHFGLNQPIDDVVRAVVGSTGQR